jgi:hypothetical protein
MAEKRIGNLMPDMQERLEKWRAKVLPVKSEEKVRGKSPLKRRYLRGDYGDDITEDELQQEKAWAVEDQKYRK